MRRDRWVAAAVLIVFFAFRSASGQVTPAGNSYIVVSSATPKTTFVDYLVASLFQRGATNVEPKTSDAPSVANCGDGAVGALCVVIEERTTADEDVIIVKVFDVQTKALVNQITKPIRKGAAQTDADEVVARITSNRAASRTTTLMAVSATPVDISGTWFASAPDIDGSVAEETYNLTSDGGTIVGTLRQISQNASRNDELQDGRREGNRIFFTVRIPTSGLAFETRFVGEVLGNQMRLNRALFVDGEKHDAVPFPEVIARRSESVTTGPVASPPTPTYPFAITQCTVTNGRLGSIMDIRFSADQTGKYELAAFGQGMRYGQKEVDVTQPGPSGDSFVMINFLPKQGAGGKLFLGYVYHPDGRSASMMCAVN